MSAAPLFHTKKKNRNAKSSLVVVLLIERRALYSVSYKVGMYLFVMFTELFKSNRLKEKTVTDRLKELASKPIGWLHSEKGESSCGVFAVIILVIGAILLTIILLGSDDPGQLIQDSVEKLEEKGQQSK